jgi:hypothetical protein
MSETEDVLRDEEQILELGIMLGQRRTLGLIAGRCSAAQAACMRKMRDEKVYARLGHTWDEYCEKRLKMNRRTVDRIIALERELGAMFFEAAAVTGITAPEYRRIAFAFQADGIHAGGEVIALIPENSERAIEAVAKLKAEADAREAAAPESPAQQQIRALAKRGHDLAKAFRKIAKTANEAERSVLRSSITGVSRDLDRILLEYTS